LVSLRFFFPKKVKKAAAVRRDPNRGVLVMLRTPRLREIAILLVVFSAGPAVAQVPDKNLEAAIRSVIFEMKAPLNEEQLNKVYVLDAVGKNIKELTGLEKCKNLASLRLSKNEITDVKALAGLKNLQSLDLAGNKIKDVTPLGTLEGLQYLELSSNQISDLAPLKGLARLTSLYVGGNQLKDIGPVANLTRLWSFYAAKNQISDISALAKLPRLSTLELDDNQIVSLAPLGQLTELNLVLLERNKITDLKPLVDAAQKDAAGPKRFAPFLRIYLEGNPLSSEALATQLPALQKAGVRVFGVEKKPR
jgi:internalin A